MKNLLLSLVILLAPIAVVSAHPPLFHKQHLKRHHPEIQLIIVSETEVANGKLLEILKKAKKGTVIVIKGVGRFVKGTVKGITRPLRPDKPKDGTCPNCKPKSKKK